MRVTSRFPFRRSVTLGPSPPTELAADALAVDRPPDAPERHADVSAETPPYEGPAEASARRRSRQRADALVELVAGRTAESPPVTVPADADAPVDADDLEGRAETTCEVENGPALTLDAVRRLCCDGPPAAIVERGGEVVGSGRRTRTISGSSSRAMRRRDGGTCTDFPWHDAAGGYVAPSVASGRSFVTRASRPAPSPPPAPRPAPRRARGCPSGAAARASRASRRCGRPGAGSAARRALPPR